MTYKEAFKRAGVTFVAGVTAAPISAAVVDDIDFYQAAIVGGIIAIWNLVGRLAQSAKADWDTPWT